MTRQREGSVVNLQELYTVAIGVSLAEAIQHLFAGGTSKSGNPLDATLLPMFVALVALLIPFYHGAMRHLDKTYIEEEGRHVRGGALLADFILLFVEACLFLGAAVLLRTPWYAAWTLAILLLFDAVWGTIVQWALYTTSSARDERWWIYINIVFAPAIMVVLLLNRPASGGGRMSSAVSVVILCLVLARTVLDYVTSWNVYFPSG